MGVLFVLAPFVPRLALEWHMGSLMERAGRSGPVVTGAAFALAWTPCTGPTLGAIVTAAGVSGSAAHGAFLLAVYCAGLGVPFLITGLAFGKATSALAVVKRHYPVVIGARRRGPDRDGRTDLDGRVHAAEHHRGPLAAVARAAEPQLRHLIGAWQQSAAWAGDQGYPHSRDEPEHPVASPRHRSPEARHSRRSPTTGSCRIATPARWWRPTAASSGCACRGSTRRACSGRCSTAAAVHSGSVRTA